MTPLRPLTPLVLMSSLLTACGGGLPEATHPWGLAAESLQALEARPGARAQVERLLEEHFGTPAAPDAAPLGDGTDPDALDFERLEARLARAVRIDNERRFVDALELLDAGRVIGIELPAALAAQQQTWIAEVARRAPEQVASEAAQVLRSWLPSAARSSAQYARSCLTCHGPEGGGNGPSAAVLSANPPRDFRSGQFLHFADHLRARPACEELVEVLHAGVAGTPMASFKSLPAGELVGLARHVMSLSVRGEFERALVGALEGGSELDEARVAALYAAAWGPWLDVPKSFESPEEPQIPEVPLIPQEVQGPGEEQRP
jgi:cytochrome c553